eukprot:6487540-Amphidinium_carterae.1
MSIPHLPVSEGQQQQYTARSLRSQTRQPIPGQGQDQHNEQRGTFACRCLPHRPIPLQSCWGNSRETQEQDEKQVEALGLVLPCNGIPVQWKHHGVPLLGTDAELANAEQIHRSGTRRRHSKTTLKGGERLVEEAQSPWQGAGCLPSGAVATALL